MAHLHFHRTVYKSGGSKAKARVEYITRTELQDLKAERQLRYIGRTDREDLRYTNSRNLPAWAEGAAQRYFETAERYEWAKGNAFEEWKLTLPHELTPGENMALMRDVVDVIAGDRLPITYAFHAPSTLSESREQPHLHLLLSGRQLDGITRTPVQHFKKYNTTHPARGGAPKDAALYHLRAVKAWRVTITDVVNLHLERAGQESRVHPDRLDDRAIARRPEPKLRPSESRAYREHGTVTPRMQEVLESRTARHATRHDEVANARMYWTQRKQALGITETMDLPTQLTLVREARATVRDHAPGTPQTPQVVSMDQDVVGQGGVEDHETVEGWQSIEATFGALARQLDVLTTGEGQAGAVRMRLWDPEHGMGR